MSYPLLAVIALLLLTVVFLYVAHHIKSTARWISTSVEEKISLWKGAGYTSAGLSVLILIVIYWKVVLIIAGSVIALWLLVKYLKYYYSVPEIQKRRERSYQRRAARELREEENKRRKAEESKRKEEQRIADQRRRAEEQKRREEIKLAEQARYEAEQHRAREEQKRLQDRLIPRVITERKPDSGDTILRAGDMGEEILANAFVSHGNFIGCFWWSSKRVKEALGERGPNEIDLIVLSHNYIYCLEAKHYAGTLIRNPNHHDKKNPWIRLKPKRDESGKIVNDSTSIELVENFDEILGMKAAKLHSYLSKKGIQLPPEIFKRKIVFTNQYFVVDEVLKTDTRLVAIQDLTPYLNADGGAANEASFFVAALIRHLLEEEKPVNINIPDIGFSSLVANLNLVKCINALPSWDHLTYFGGKRIRGDMLSGLEIFEDTKGLELINDDCDILFQCERDPNRIRQCWDNAIPMRAEVLSSDGRRRISKSLDYKNPWVKFHAVGDQKPTEISVYEIEKIELRGLSRF